MSLRIDRPVLDGALLAFAQAGHGLILGRAGVGKSFSLSRLVQSLEHEGVPHLIVSVEDLADGTEEDIRAFLGYEEPTFLAAVSTLMASAPKGTVIFDGFDAARNEAARTRVLGLIRAALRHAPDGWTVVVSVREYDARKSPTLVGLFSRTRIHVSTAFQFSDVEARHFAVPELTEDEVTAAVLQIKGLEPVYRQASESFRRLARIPFNLWLLEKVIGATSDTEKIRLLDSEVQLLALYWSAHVTDVPDADGRAAILQSAVSNMISSRRLAFKKAEVFSASLAGPWNALFSGDVLTEGGPGKQSAHFSHNILFDYAVSVLALPDTASGLVDFLIADPSRPLFLRPSLVYYFVHVWYLRREDFWLCFWTLLGTEALAVRLVSRLLPPYVVAAQATSSSDLEPLVRRCRESRDDAGKAVLRVFQALRVVDNLDPAVWTAFAAEIAHSPSPDFAWEVATYLGRVLANSAASGRANVHASVGEASRRLFLWAWERRGPGQPWYDAYAPAVVLPLVLKTARTDVNATVSIVRKTLTLLGQKDFPIRYLNVVAEETGELVSEAPDVVAEVYRKIFAHEENSVEPTSMGGIVLRMRSNRRQDVSMCQYALARDFATFLEAAPETALAVGLDILNAYATRKQAGRFVVLNEEASPAETFMFRGATCSYVEDGSASWSSVLSHEEEGTIANALENFLGDSQMTPDRVAAIAAEHARTAWTWALVLSAGARAPERYAGVLFELALARPIQLGMDTRHPLASFIEAAAPVLPAEDLNRLQLDALNLKNAKDVRQEYLDRTSDLLLTRIPTTLLSVDAARERVEVLTKSSAVPENTPPFRHSSSSRQVTSEMWLSEQGVDLSSSPNASLFALAEKMKTFCDSWANKKPSSEAIEAFRPELTSALAILRDIPLDDDGSGGHQGTDPKPAAKIVEHVWTHLAAAAHAFARSALSPAEPAFSVARQILLRAGEFPVPTVSPERNSQFDSPSWSPSPRTEAIQGLSNLSFHVTDDASIPQAFATFAGSPEPSERFLVAWHLPNLRRNWPELFWSVVKERAKDEGTPSIVATLVRSIWAATSLEDERGPDVLRVVLARWLADESSSLRQEMAGSLARLAFVKNDQWAWDRLRELQANVRSGHELLGNVIADAVNSLTRGKDEKAEPEIDGRIIEWLLELLSVLKDRARSARGQPQVGEGSTRSDTTESAPVEELRAAHDLVGEVVRRVYFGARRDDSRGRIKKSGDETGALREYIELIRPVMRAILSFADADGANMLNAGAAHEFMQLLNIALPFGPEEALAMAATTATSASAGGYQFDSLAVKEVVGLVEVVLADYRDRLATGKALRDTLALLDVFADAGWPEALRLVWRLDEVFR